ncbi:MAG: hypothetical protein ACT4TC_18595 [Myxococcaceae bacterium]
MNRLLFAAAVALLGAACGPASFNTTVKGQATIQGDPNGLLGMFAAFPGLSGFSKIDFNQDQEFRNQGVKKENVTSVKTTKILLTITNPTDGDFKFLDQLQFIAKSDGLADVVVAEKTGISSLPASTTLEMDVKDVELQPYVTAPSMTLSTAGRGG